MQLDLFIEDVLDVGKDAAPRGRKRTPRVRRNLPRNARTLPPTMTDAPAEEVGLFAPIGDEPPPRLEIVAPMDVAPTEDVRDENVEVAKTIEAAEEFGYADRDEEADEERPARIPFDPAVWMRRSDEGDFIHVRTGEVRDEDEFVSSFDVNDTWGEAHESWDESQDLGDDVPY